MSDAGRNNDLAHLKRRGVHLPLPAFLLDLLAAERWEHPGDEALRKIMPWFEDPLDFLTSEEKIRRESRSLFSLAERDGSARLFRLARGSTRASPIELPWLDVELAVLIAVNHFPGDDVAIALDYRTSRSDPRVVASDFWTDPHQCAWRTIAPSLSAFTIALDPANPRQCPHASQSPPPLEASAPPRADQAFPAPDSPATSMTRRLKPTQNTTPTSSTAPPAVHAGDFRSCPSTTASAGSWSASIASTRQPRSELPIAPASRTTQLKIEVFCQIPASTALPSGR